MSDKFYDFDKDNDDVYEIYKKDAVKKPAQKEFEIDISPRTANFKSTMPGGNTGKSDKLSPADKIKRHKLSAGGKAFMVFGIIMSCFLTVFGTFSGVVLGPVFSTGYFRANSPEDGSSALKNVEKEEYHIEVNDDGTVTPVYNEIPTFDEGSKNSSVTSSDDKGYDEPDSNGGENKDENAEDGKDNKDDTEDTEDSEDTENKTDSSGNGNEENKNDNDSEPTAAPSPTPSAKPDEEIFNEV